MSDPCHAEVLGLHRFFDGWLSGRSPDDEETFARVVQVLAGDFRIVSPDGRLTERDALLAGLRGAHGSLSEAGPFEIWIEGFVGRPVASGLHLCTYEEWQRRGSETKGRRSTALLRENPVTPEGVEWLHVHETWLAG